MGPKTAPLVTVVGAGIVGATVAFFLSNANARVRVIEKRRAPGLGVSSHSFGWINYATSDAQTPVWQYEGRRQAVRDFAGLNRALGDRLEIQSRGSLTWKATAAETEAHAGFHAASGNPTRLLGSSEIARLAPDLVAPPPFATYSPDELAIDTRHATRTLLRAAVDAGAEIILDCDAERVALDDRGARGLVCAGELLRSDFVVIAAGAESGHLLPNGVRPPMIETSPAALVTIDGVTARPDCVLEAPDLEVRSGGGSTLLVAMDVRSSDKDEIDEAGAAALSGVKRHLHGTADAQIRSIGLGMRPMTANGRPLAGPHPDVRNLFFAVAHPGVILAPAIASSITGQICGAQGRSGLQPPFNSAPPPSAGGQ